MTDLGGQIFGAFAQLVRSAIDSAPRVVVGVALLALAWIVAKLVEVVLRRVFVRCASTRPCRKPASTRRSGASACASP
jgi:hypothetical protein